MGTDRPSTERVAAAVGAGTVGVGCLLSALLLLALTGTAGDGQPFTTLTAGDRVSPVHASVWTFLDAQFVHPRVTMEPVPAPDGGRMIVIGDILYHLDLPADGVAALRLVPPALFAVAGAVAAWLSRRRFPGVYPVVAGARIVFGAFPATLVLVVFSGVPITPGDASTVVISGTTVDADVAAGATVRPDLVRAAVVGFVFPLIFGGVGGGLTALLRWLAAKLSTTGYP